MTQEEARHLIHQITEAVNSQMEDRIRIYEHKIVRLCAGIILFFYQSKQEVEPFHQEFISNFLRKKFFPIFNLFRYARIESRLFLRDNRLYLSVRVTRKDTGKKEYYIIKLPYSKVPRFIELPTGEKLLPDVYGRYYKRRISTVCFRAMIWIAVVARYLVTPIFSWMMQPVRSYGGTVA